ncbi:MAG: heat-shock protein Hsp70 [Planctomycetaceae bacterium]|nr:heat-shock protein Hsp70 [Planctomycetaceae bacterium]
MSDDSAVTGFRQDTSDSDHIVGIDLGTSYSSLAVLDEEGHPRVIDNSGGSPLTASVVLLAEGGRAFVDPEMELLADAQPEQRILGIKREMGNPRYAVRHENRRLTPELVSSLILKRLRQDAEPQLGPIRRAVITVPYYFNEPRRRATRNAGQIAGLDVVDILNEPTAATLTYAWAGGALGGSGDDRPRQILVYDLGGGTFDVTLVEFTATHLRVKATDGDTMLGGIDWTSRLADLVAEEVIRHGGTDPRATPASHFLLTQKSEQAKRDLSDRLVTSVSLPHDGRGIEIDVTRTGFERQSADLLQRTRDTTELVLAQAGIDGTDLDDIVLIGGSTAMPGVRVMLESLSGQPPSTVLDPQRAVAQGAAIHAAILEARQVGAGGQIGQALIQRLRSITTSNVNSHSLGVEVTNRNDLDRRWNHVMIPRNTPIPCTATQRFVTNTGNPRSIHIRLLEGEVSDVDACTVIGDFRVVDLPEGLAVGSPIEIEYGYDRSGHIHVAARELVTNTAASIVVHWSSGVDELALAGFTRLAGEYDVD